MSGLWLPEARRTSAESIWRRFLCELPVLRISVWRFGRRRRFQRRKLAQDVARAGETVEARKHLLADLDAQFQAEAAAIETGGDLANEGFETIELRPNKTNITVKLVARAWTPHVRDESAQLRLAL